MTESLENETLPTREFSSEQLGHTKRAYTKRAITVPRGENLRTHLGMKRALRYVDSARIAAKAESASVRALTADVFYALSEPSPKPTLSTTPKAGGE